MVRATATALAALSLLELHTAQYTGQTCNAIMEDGTDLGACAFPWDASGNAGSADQQTCLTGSNLTNDYWCSINAVYQSASNQWGGCQCSCDAGYTGVDSYTTDGAPTTGDCEAAPCNIPNSDNDVTRFFLVCLS